MEYYYCDESNTVRGPKSESAMRSLRASGILRDDTKVCPAGTDKWRSYAEVFPAAPSTGPSAETLKKAARPRLSPEHGNALKEMRVRSQGILQTVLLLLIVVMLGINMFRAQEVKVVVPDIVPEYQYGTLHLSREDMQSSYDVARRLGLDSDGVCPLNSEIAQRNGWEYVGIICNDGINASWLLMRRTKESARKEEASNP